MPVYRVRILGELFTRELDGAPTALGFLTNQFVDASDAATAEREALSRLHARDDLAGELRDGRGTLTVEETVAVDAMPATPEQGLVWFPLDPQRTSSH